jgi:hypothetical protein
MMQTGGTIKSAATIATTLLLLGVAGFVGLFGLAAVPPCMCAAPPPGWHQVVSLPTVLKVVGPPLAVFLAGEFFALAPASRNRRLIASGVAVVVASAVFAYTAYRFLPCCGEWAP